MRDPGRLAGGSAGEFSPMPAVNTSASKPPSAAVSEPISRTMR